MSDPRVKKQLLEYDANGNLLAIKKQVSDPQAPLGYREETVRQNIWDEENRIRAVDLQPEAPGQVAAYTYDAGGERIVKYLPGRLDAYYSARPVGSTDRLEAILYPSPLLTVKTLPLPEELDEDRLQSMIFTNYTKHYYIGAERISSTLGTVRNLGLLCEQNFPGDYELIEEMNERVKHAGEVLVEDYTTFGKELQLKEPYLYPDDRFLYCRKDHDQINTL